MSEEEVGSKSSGGKQVRRATNRILYRAAYAVGAEGEGALKEVEFESVEEALSDACRDLLAGYKPIGIWAPDRSLIHSAASIRELCGQPGS